MKKTLFLTIIAAAVVAPAHATVEGVRVDPGHGVYVSTDLTIDSTNADDYLQPGTFGDAGSSAGVVVGTSHGEGILTVTGVEVSTPNNLYISGNGGGDQSDQTAIPGEMHNGTVVLKEGAKLTVSGDNTDWNGMQLQVGTSSAGSQGTLKVESGSTLDAGPRVYVGGGNSDGNITISGAGSSATVSGARVDSNGLGITLVAGADSGTKGVVTVADGASLSVKNDGAYSQIYSNIVLGDKGEGELNITGAGTSFDSDAPQFNLGYTEGSKGVVNVSDGAAFTSKASRVLYVGYYGDGEFNVSNATDVTATGGLYVGFKEGSSGAINVDDNAAMKINSIGTLYLGYEGAAELNVSNGSTVTISGQVVAGTNVGSSADINVTGGSTLKLSTNNLYLGNAEGSEAHLTVDADSKVTISGLLSAGWGNSDSTIDNAGYISCGRGATIRYGTEINNTGTIENKSTYYNITLMEGTDASNSGDIISACGMKLASGATLDNTDTGTITTHGSGFLIMDEGTQLTNTGTITSDTAIAVDAGGSLHNTGTITIKKVDDKQSFYGFGIGEGANIFTGVVSVSGRPDQISGEAWSELTEDQISYDTGIRFEGFEGYDKPLFDDQSNGTVTLGALIEGEDTLQYLYKKDWQSIQNSIASGLGVSGTGVAYANEIGKNISAHFTTDEVSGDDHFVVAIGDGEVVVDRGENFFDGTIGSYSEDINESKADIRLDEKASGGHVSWGGDTLKTVDTNKDTVFTPNVKVDFINEDGSRRTDGKLVVVKDTTLRGTGTVDGTVAVEDGATLAVGAPTGAMTVGAAEISGALVFTVTAADTCSQLALVDGTGSLTFTPTATIGIKLCSDDILPAWSAKDYEFDLTLVTGIDSLKVWDETFTGNTLTASAVEHLKGMTSFSLDPDALGLPDFDASASAVTPAEFTYTLESDGNGSYALHVKGRMTVPEPATVTLSLLALAGLCARRRRK